MPFGLGIVLDWHGRSFYLRVTGEIRILEIWFIMNLRTIRRVWRALVPRRFRKSARYMVFGMLRLYVHYQDSRCKRTRASNSKLITVVGLFDETNGIANSAKLAVRAFQTLLLHRLNAPAVDIFPKIFRSAFFRRAQHMKYLQVLGFFCRTKAWLSW